VLKVDRPGFDYLAQLKTLKVDIHNMGVGREGPWPPWIFIDCTDKVEGGLMVLFFGLVFTVKPPPGNFSADAFDSHFTASLLEVQHKKG